MGARTWRTSRSRPSTSTRGRCSRSRSRAGPPATRRRCRRRSPPPRRTSPWSEGPRRTLRPPRAWAPRLAGVVADKGYHSNAVLVALTAAGHRSYIAEPDRGRRDWTDKATERDAVYANRRRIRGRRGKALLRSRGELSARPFAHALETGAMRRTHLRLHENILKRLLVHVSGLNLGLLMRTRFGVGTPRGQLAGAGGPAHPLGRAPAAAAGGHRRALRPPRPARARPRVTAGAPPWWARVGGRRCGARRHRGFHHGLLDEGLASEAEFPSGVMLAGGRSPPVMQFPRCGIGAKCSTHAAPGAGGDAGERGPTAAARRLLPENEDRRMAFFGFVIALMFFCHFRKQMRRARRELDWASAPR